MSRFVLIARLAIRDLRHRRAQAVLLLLAITAATATLTLGLALNGVTSSPYFRTKAATNGPDVTAFVSSTAQSASLSGASGVNAHSGPYPLASAALGFRGLTVPVQAEGRDEAPTAVDQPDVTAGTWVRPGSVVLERTFAEALGVTVGDRVTLNGRLFRVSGIAVTAAIPEYPGVCYYMTCHADSQSEESGMGLAWVTQAAARSFATAASPVSYVLNLRLRGPAAAAAFATAHGPVSPSGPVSSSGPALLTWEQVQYADNALVSVAQQVLTPGAWLAMVLAVASAAVLAGGRMAEQTRRVGQLKAAGATPALVALVLLAEHLLVALVAAAAGLGIGWLATPLLSNAGAGLLGVPGAPALTLGTVGLVVAVAAGVTLAATLVPAFRAAHTSTVSALENTARPPRRHAMLIAISRRLPISLQIGIRLIARRPRRAALAAASTATTVTAIVAVLAAHHAGDVSAGRFNWFAGLSDPVSGRVSQVMGVLTVVLVTLAAVNAVVTGWATALDARQPSAVSRVLGGTPWQVSTGLSAAQVLPALPGSLVGVPLGIALFALANGAGGVSVPPGSWLVAVVLGTLAAVAALTTVPAILGARQPVVLILRSESA
ncbi:MAG TPA: FtsX-like permease family protein [Trebonia sp.]|jgi:putative ABC transport system permease protein|nr:FtsX-like permease family protein [Trebonia sp.]